MGIKNTNKNKIYCFLRYLFDYCIVRKIYLFKIIVARLLFFVLFFAYKRQTRQVLSREVHALRRGNKTVRWSERGFQMESEEAEMHFSLNGSLLLSGEGVFQVYFSFFLTLFLFLRGFFSFNSFVSHMLQEKERYVGTPTGGIVGKSIRYCCIP